MTDGEYGLPLDASQNNTARRDNPCHQPIKPIFKPRIAKNTHLIPPHKLSVGQGITKPSVEQKFV